MCNPAVLAFIPAIIQGGQQHMQGQMAEGNAKVNAALSEMQADDSLRRGMVEEDRYRRMVAQVAGRQRAEIGARNVRADSGTALDLVSDTAQFGELDALTIRNEAAREAWGYRFQADDSRRYGRQMAAAGNTAAGGSLLTGGAQAYGRWRDYQRTGSWG